MQVKEVVYLHLDQRDLHQQLLGSPHLADFVQFLVCGKRVERLLLRTLQAGRAEEAEQLVQMYHAQHGSPTCSTGTRGRDLLRVRLRKYRVG